MLVSDILAQVADTSGTNTKLEVLRAHASNPILVKALRMGHDPFTPFHVVKVPAVAKKQRRPAAQEEERWAGFFAAAERCAAREVTGNAAIAAIGTALCQATEAEEGWMRKILKKHMALGASEKTINKALPGTVPTFEVQLAQKFEEKRLRGRTEVAVEPKLDGIRCLAVVRKGSVTMLARSGKQITNFDETVGAQLLELGDGAYDGEIMGRDFTALMRQAYRKDHVDVSDTYFALFDFLPLSEWDSKETVLTCSVRYQELRSRVVPGLQWVRVVPRSVVPPDWDTIKGLHDEYAAQGYEGAMVKDTSAPYRFGRGTEVMKLKAFHDVDLEIEGFVEGTGKHEGKLGSVVVSYEGVEVQVGSGWSDELREEVWADREAFLGRVIEVRYQEVTPDGSLRFPTFRCFRNDR
jgi:DNA ligase-1